MLQVVSRVLRPLVSWSRTRKQGLLLSSTAVGLLLGTACSKSTITALTACDVDPTSLSFNPVTVGACSDPQEFILKNNSAGPVGGFIEEPCADFEILFGDGPYRLGPGQGVPVRLRFCPQSAGVKTCSIETGSGICKDIALSGTANPSAACQLSTTTLNFAAATLGSCTPTQNFTITNTGGAMLTGSVSESCPDFEITAGSGAYSLGPGQVHTVTVRFCPMNVGARTCTIETGSPLCSDITATGTGNASAACQVSPTTVDFGNVTVGTCSGTQTFTITNSGGTTLAGAVSASCPDFQILSGGGAYSLGAGQSRTVTVQFCPQSQGPKSCTIETGQAACSDVQLSGVAEASLACQVSPSGLEFGYEPVGACSPVQEFAITNIGMGTVSGTVSESCPDFEIVSGGGSYTLGAGQSRTVAVRFCPQSEGPKSCTIETGSATCGDVTLNGVGSDCQVSPTFITFGDIPIGTCSGTQSFTITNNGSGLLSGEVTELCSEIEFVSGGGPYSLHPGQSKTVVIRFCPLKLTSGERRVIRLRSPESPQGACMVQTGPTCSEVIADGDGVF